MANYRKRRSAFEGEANREMAIKRMRDEASVRSKMADSGPRGHASLPKRPIPESQQPVKKGPPQAQLNAAQRARARADRERITSRKPPDIRQAMTGRRVRRQLGTLAGRRIAGHRMPLWQALSRRSTGSSRARVLSKYGVKRSDGTYSSALNRVAEMRKRATGKRMTHLPQARRRARRVKV
jgi:hypothetical protein